MTSVQSDVIFGLLDTRAEQGLKAISARIETANSEEEVNALVAEYERHPRPLPAHPSADSERDAMDRDFLVLGRRIIEAAGRDELRHHQAAHAA